MTKTNVKVFPTSFWLDADTRQALEELAAEFELSRSAVVREAINRMRADPKEVEIRSLVQRLFKVVTGSS